MRSFFDSNVLVYALSSQDTDKRLQALSLIGQASAQRALVVSTQVLVETFNVLTRKCDVLARDALDALRLLTPRCEVVVPDAAAVLRALELAVEHSLSPWDGLIVQAALLGDCSQLYTEDMQHGRRFGGLQILNPFLASANQPPAAATAAPRRRKR